MLFGIAQRDQSSQLPQELGVAEAPEAIPEDLGFVVALTGSDVDDADFVRFEGRNEIEQCYCLQIAGADLDGMLAGEMWTGMVKLKEH